MGRFTATKELCALLKITLSDGRVDDLAGLKFSLSIESIEISEELLEPKTVSVCGGKSDG